MNRATKGKKKKGKKKNPNPGNVTNKTDDVNNSLYINSKSNAISIFPPLDMNEVPEREWKESK